MTNSLYFDKVYSMKKEVSKIWEDVQAQQLADALTIITDKNTMQNFLNDVMTAKEITEMGARLEAARMLQAGDKYIDITKKTKLSSRTVARISDWLKNGCNGYQAALQTINQHHDHIPPVRAD